MFQTFLDLPPARQLLVLVTGGVVATAEARDPALSITSRAMEEVVVSADPLRRSDAHLIQPTTVLDREQLAREVLRNIGEAVGHTPGVSSADLGANVGRPVIRGLTGARVQVLDDGVGSLDVSSLSPDHAVASIARFARQVEIFRGPATLLYGSGASGGIVNVVDDRILDVLPERPSGELRTDYDTATEGRSAALRVETALGRHLALHLDALGEANESYEIPGTGDRAPAADARRGRLPHSQGEQEAAAGGLSWVGDQGFLGLAVQRFDRHYGVPGLAAHAHDAGEEEAGADPGVSIAQHQTRFDLKGEWRDPFPGVRAFRTRWGSNDHNHVELEGAEVGTQLVNVAHEGRFEWLHAPLAGFTGVFGVQLQARDFQAVGEEAFVPDSQQTTTAGFIVEERDFGPFHAEAGFRMEHVEAENARTGRTAEFDAQALSGGLSWIHGFWGELGAAATRAERAPAIEELFADGPHLATGTFEIGDPGLAAETSTNIDVYWRRAAGAWSLSLGFFHNDIDDYLFAAAQDTNADGIADRVEDDFGATGLLVAEPDALLLVRQTQADARLWGFEFESLLTVLDDARGTAIWRVWSDYTEAAFEDEARVPRIPPLRYGTGVEWQRGAWLMDLRFMRVTSQSRTAALETTTDGYSALDLGVEYTLPVGEARALVIFARGHNLLDEEIRRHVSFLKDFAPQPGRGGQLGFRLLF